MKTPAVKTTTIRVTIKMAFLLLLTSCVTNSNSTRLVLSDINDHASVKTLTQKHELRISEQRILYYNNDEKFRVPEGMLVVFESQGNEEPVFTLMEKDGRHFNIDYNF